MTADDLKTLRAIVAGAKPGAIVEALPVAVLAELLAAYDAPAPVPA